MAMMNAVRATTPNSPRGAVALARLPVRNGSGLTRSPQLVRLCSVIAVLAETLLSAMACSLAAAAVSGTRLLAHSQVPVWIAFSTRLVCSVLALTSSARCTGSRGR